MLMLTKFLTIRALRNANGSGGGSSADVRYVTFKSEDGSTTYGKKAVAAGDDCADPIARGVFDTPTKEPDEQYTYPFYGWATEPNGGADADWNKAVTEDRTVYAVLTASTRYYAVRFWNEDKLEQTVNVRYRENATYTAATPVKAGHTFTGWNPEPTNVTKDMDCYAQFESTNIDFSTTDFSQGYSVEWDYTQSSPALTRIGLSSGLSDPAPATSLTVEGSSPFDNVMPWAGMKRYNIIDGAVAYSEDDAGFSMTDYDTVVYIPEFYYAAYKDTENSKWRWSISPTPKEGYELHPGSGRYIGRYHTSGDSSAVFSKSGIQPLGKTTIANFRDYSHNKGENWWMLDMATWSALQLLYLVEFANFHSQNKLGTGNYGKGEASGATDGSVYHTYNGSSKNQYRWVESPHGGMLDFVDGIVASNRVVYIGTNNSLFSNETKDLNTSQVTLPTAGYIKNFGYSTMFPWAFIPYTSGGSKATFVPDYTNSATGICGLIVGGEVGINDGYGLFYFDAHNSMSNNSEIIGSRLIFIP
jgi:hypothetical protein